MKPYYHISVRNLTLIIGLFTTIFTYGGQIIMSSSNTTGTISNNGTVIVIKDSETIKLKVTCQIGNVSATFTPSSGVNKTSDDGIFTKNQTAIFSLNSTCVGTHNTIGTHVNHNDAIKPGHEQGHPCLPDGLDATFHIFIPKLEFNLSSWSAGNALTATLAANLSVSNPPPIGVLTSATYKGKPMKMILFEYIVSVAAGATAIRVQNLDIIEYGNTTAVPVPSGNPPNMIPYKPSPTYYRHGSKGYVTLGTDLSDPKIYACDAPGVERNAVQNYLIGAGKTKVTITTSLQSRPVYKGQSVGKEETKNFLFIAEHLGGGAFSWSGGPS